MADEIVITSTTDTPEAIEAALHHGEATSNDEVLSVEGEAASDEKAADAQAEKPDEKKVDEKKPEEKKAAAEKVEEKKARSPEDEELGRRAQKRIDKLVAEREAANRRADELETRLKALEDKKPGEEKKAEVKVDADAEWLAANPEPKQDDFADYEAFSKKWTEWKLDQRDAIAVRKAEEAAAAKANEILKKRDEEDAAKRETESRAEQFERFNETKDEARARYDDFDEVIAGAKEMRLSGPMQYILMDSAVGHDIAYWFAKHPTEAAEFSEMEGAEAIRELGRLERNIELQVASAAGKKAAADKRAADDAAAGERESADAKAAEEDAEPEKKPAEKKAAAPKAPAPIKPVGGRSVATRVDLNDPNVPYEDFKTMRNRQEAARKSARR